MSEKLTSVLDHGSKEGTYLFITINRHGLDPNNGQKPSNPPFEKKGNFGINYSLGTVTPGLPSTQVRSTFKLWLMMVRGLGLNLGLNSRDCTNGAQNCD